MIVTLGKLAILDSRKQGIFRIVVFCVVALIYVSIPNARPDFTRFNCHDSESYLALSGSLVHGAGYTRNMKPNQYVAHTTWPPVVPVLMMPAMALSGDKINWLAVKWSMVIVGLIGVVCVWLLARRIGGSDFYGDLAALAIALNPLYWDFSHQAMAEVPLTVWLLGSILLIDYCWVGRKVRLWEALTVGCICGIGMLIKGHAIGLMLAPLAFPFYVG